MDVVFITTALERGGAETQLVRIATTLRRRGWAVGILTMMPSSAFLEEVAAAGIPLVECPDARALLPLDTGLRMIRQLRCWQPALVITFNFPADAFGRICGRMAGVPTIVSALGTTHVKSVLRKQFYRLSEPLIAMTVANSKAAARGMVTQGLLTREKTRVIPNGLILEPAGAAPGTRAAVRAELGVGDAEFLWLAVGNLRPAKDYPTLLSAAARCARSAPGMRIRIVGSDFAGTGKGAGGRSFAETLRRQAERLNLGAAVQFLGARSDVARLLCGADGFVLASAWEGLPNTVMEAMAAGLPVVSTDVGDVAELVQEGISGFLVEPREPRKLAERMLAMMGLPEAVRHAMGAQGMARIRARYDNERVVDEWEDLFRGLATRQVPGPLEPSRDFP